MRDVCISHQSDWIYFKQPIKFLVVKVNGMLGDLIPVLFRTAKKGNIHVLGLLQHFLWVRLCYGRDEPSGLKQCVS